MAKVSAISKGVGTVSESITISIGSIESIGFWLSLSITLSIVARISKTITMMTIAKRRVAKSNMMTITITMSKRIDTVAKTILHRNGKELQHQLQAQPHAWQHGQLQQSWQHIC